MIAFTVPGAPVPWQRTATHAGRRLTPKRQRDYQRHVKACALEAHLRSASRGYPMCRSDRFAVELRVYSQDKRARDVDNLAKTVLDACTGVIWLDDAQIDALAVVRRIDREQPRVEVEVEVIEEGADVVASIEISAPGARAEEAAE